jgi:hypothetical protein
LTSGRFGFNLATDGLRLLVSAPGEGKIFAFEFAPNLPSRWNLTQVISATVFGEIALSGNRAFVGDPLADPQGVQNAGQVHVFDLSQSGWSFVASVQANPPLAGRGFGGYLAVADSELVVGENTNPPAGCTGRVYRFNTANLQLVGSLPPPTGELGCSLFGTGVRASSSTIVVRARDDNASGSQSGAAFIYQRHPSGSFTQVAKFAPTVTAVNTEWGMGDIGNFGGSEIVVVTGEKPDGQYVPASLLTRSVSGWGLLRTLARPPSSQAVFAGRSVIALDTIVTAATSSNQTSLYFFPVGPDCNDNGFGDGYEQSVFPFGSPCAIEWKVEEGGNGHWYELIEDQVITSWPQAKTFAEARGGNLATVLSVAESDFIWTHLASNPAGWKTTFNSSGPALGGYEDATGWKWVTGEPWSYTNWGSCFNQIGENRLHFGCDSVSNAWNNLFDWETNIGGAIVEYSADCNNDGAVDYGQIAIGQLQDANTNGIPDICESSVTVPTQYPTIQAAIDATPAGTARTINVLAGTYNESFALNGENVVVRGAPGNATILNGAKLTTSIARFTGNEPATAGLENLVFRNGTVGQPINPPSYNFTGGGGVFGKDSSAFIKNCRFEDCGADFGAGVYLLRCTVNVDGCVFSSNDATTDGGGMQTFACSGTIKNSTFTGNRCALTYAGSGSAFKGVGIRTAGTTLTLEACTISGNPIPNAGAAVEYFENVKMLAGVFRIVDTDIVSNAVGSGSVDDAGGLRVLGRQQSCVLSGGTTICSNTPRNVVGPYLIDGSATVCDCEGDLSGNGQVDAADLGILLSVWGTSPANGQGDLNHDGIVSAPDLSALLALWGPCQ